MQNTNIFIAVAQTALAMGCEIELEHKDYEGESKIVGNMSTLKRTDKGLILRAFPPEDKEDAEEDGSNTDDEEEDDEDADT